MSIVTNKHERIRFLKFSFVGVTGTIVDFGVMNLLTLLLHLAPIWAQVISFTVAVVNNFLWNRYWTYPESRSKNIQKQLLQFFLINIIGILIRTLIFSPLNSTFLRIFEQTKLNLPIEDFILSYNLALAGSIVIILFWNFFANRYWTYGDIPIGHTKRKQAPSDNANK